MTGATVLEDDHDLLAYGISDLATLDLSVRMLGGLYCILLIMLLHMNTSD